MTNASSILRKIAVTLLLVLILAPGVSGGLSGRQRQKQEFLAQPAHHKPDHGPEPGSSGMLLIAAVAALLRRNRRRG